MLLANVMVNARNQRLTLHSRGACVVAVSKSHFLRFWHIAQPIAARTSNPMVQPFCKEIPSPYIPDVFLKNLYFLPQTTFLN